MRRASSNTHFPARIHSQLSHTSTHDKLTSPFIPSAMTSYPSRRLSSSSGESGHGYAVAFGGGIRDDEQDSGRADAVIMMWGAPYQCVSLYMHIVGELPAPSGARLVVLFNLQG